MRLTCIAALLAVTAAAAQAETVTVFAAASLKTAMDDISAAYTAATGNTARVSLAGSSALARQIEAGAPADVFISANQQWMDVLQGEGLIDPDTRRDLLGNRLVLIGQGAPVEITPTLDLPGLLGEGKLAMALVDSVPAGIYGKAALTSLGLWEAVAPQVAQVDNVRAALALVAAGEAPLGITYATDAVAEPRVVVLGSFPESSHAPIVYPVAAIAEGDPLDFLTFLQGAQARAAFEAQGFAVLTP
ncbi:molybdate ABC transporter substrate-binding protein [Salipiger sp. 1_MG-2023]|uniref:molybdate ABC transporter substrate-binding protein n=1 Tax=Salipiger sp. 1_MG-2023 TaxID=3062665 RepID=UPI0026E3F528|nr:molybdate ABC transporter substrate-binding protein [Salipiger sp. 1_MG-2023]MDO6584342.1 molybdate ABC transporter substrate-binding protein [Salipiger sp. 1_MG-2023]